MQNMQQQLYRIRTQDERNAYDKQYRASHKEQIKQYQEENREQAREYAKTYREEHKELVQTKSRQYYETNKCAILEQNKQQWTCEVCKFTCQKNNKASHIKTQQHQNNLNPKTKDKHVQLKLSDGTIVTGIEDKTNDDSILFKTKEYANLTSEQINEIFINQSYSCMMKLENKNQMVVIEIDL